MVLRLRNVEPQGSTRSSLAERTRTSDGSKATLIVAEAAKATIEEVSHLSKKAGKFKRV